jgi:ABC-type bacteriocin/lantibiotic exporter with double-glycine peptidase domain
MRAVQVVVLEILQRRIFVRVVDDLAHRLPRVKKGEFDFEYGPEAVNRFFETMSVQKLGTSLFLDGVTVTIQMIVGMTILGFYHPWLLGFDFLLITMVAFVVFVIGRGGVRLSIDESYAKYHTAAWLQDLARCPGAFKTAGAAEFAFDRADALAKRYLDFRTRHFRILIRQILFVLALEAFASAVLLGLGGWLVIQGQLTLGQLVAAELIVTMIIGNIAKLGKHFETFFDLLAALDKLGHLFDLPTEPADGRYTLPMPRGMSVKISDVVFHYPSTGGGVGPITDRIDPGESVALVGPPGSGKSTLADLLFALRTPDAGAIRMDENDLRQLHPESLRRDVALVRDIEIFDGTIAENIHMGRSEVLDADVHRTMLAVGLDEEIGALPEGIETRLTRASGLPLTDSQLRRLMLARALAGKPRFLVVDGLLDSLSTELIERLAPALFGSSRSMSMLLITWRRELIERCDRTIQIERSSHGGHAVGAHHGGHA